MSGIPSRRRPIPPRDEGARTVIPEKEQRLKFFGLATTEGPRKYIDAASIAVDGGDGRVHFLSVPDGELRKLVNDATEYLRQKGANDHA